MKLDKSILLGLILGAVAAVSAHAQAADGPVVINSQVSTGFQEELHHTYPLNPAGRVELKNINGFVKISTWDRPEVKVDAVKYAGMRERLAEADIEVQADPGWVRIKTHYKDHNLTFTDDDWVNNPATVDFTLTVPAAANLDSIKLINGDLDIQNVRGDVLASCINGRLRATSLRGRTDLSTINGTLDVSYSAEHGINANVTPGKDAGLSQASNAVPNAAPSSSQPGSPPDVKLKSVNGKVVLTLPSDSNTEVHAKTVSGFISNDFGLPVEDGRYVGHTLAGRLGAGAVHIELKNVNGSISVQRASDGKPLTAVQNILPPKREREVSF